MDVIQFYVDSLRVQIHPDPASSAVAAACAAACLCHAAEDWDPLAVIFATGASQLGVLRELTARKDIAWHKILGFHLDEYAGIDPTHPASFRRYLSDNLTSRVNLREFFEIDGSSPDIDRVCRSYAHRLRKAEPQLCLLGIGENGHLAFNEPEEADFNDPQDMRAVKLDMICRSQQVAEGWFDNTDQVPARALTVTIPALLRVPNLIVSVPGARKAQIIRRTMEERISTACPATILRAHPNVTLFLDQASAAELDLAKWKDQVLL